MIFMIEIRLIHELALTFMTIYAVGLWITSRRKKVDREYDIIQEMKSEIACVLALFTVVILFYSMFLNYHPYGVRGEYEEPDEDYELYPDEHANFGSETQQMCLS